MPIKTSSVLSKNLAPANHCSGPCFHNVGILVSATRGEGK